MTWNATLALDYSRQADKTIAHFRHSGPLRILQSLYPEGEAICHNVIVHPPGGLVGGDTLDLQFHVATGAHGLVTTPGATRFYRSSGEPALQRTQISLDAGARMEWLPLEAICYSGCLAENRLTMTLAPGAELLGWDITALGLPAAGQPFERGSLLQHIEVPGRWLERGRIDSADPLLLDSPLGMAGHRCMASLFFVAGSAMARARREALLDIARGLADSHALSDTAGATSPNAEVIVLRVLAPLVEPAMQLLRNVWQAWRTELWSLGSHPPRIWAT
ncbi:urease accessory protein UreD [Polaromonas jejuensis]|uniref:Urease accessory protein UreD n=1 Tax=Polaromonas jejuensis TaxID=457502 RepID=A0ABW0QEU1_9BURK|nr:urease accessory protein UreD [Polaromonas jejuensis]